MTGTAGPMEIKAKVFGIGFHKTGTTSLGQALKILGYRVASANWQSEPNISDSVREKAFSLIDRFDAFKDNPWPLLFKEIAEKFPTSKFILTKRPVQDWIASATEHFGGSSTSMRRWIYGVGDPIGNQEIFKARYVRHNTDVEAYFRHCPERLLVMNMDQGDGWDVLCPFLGKDFPEAAFPHGNQSRARRERRGRRHFERLGSGISMNLEEPKGRQGRLLNTILQDSTISRHLDYAYLPVSKAANTFLKRLLWGLEHECGFANQIEEDYFGIHNIGWKYARGIPSPWVPIDRGMFETFQREWNARGLRFSVVRNPFSRLLSAYLDRVANQNKPVDEHLFPHLKGVPGFDPASLSFPAFVDIIAGTRDSHMNKHWLPQVHCLGLNFISCNYIGHFEKMGDVLDRLWAHFPENAASMQGINSAIHRTNASELLNRYYQDNSVIKKVYERFRSDFDLLGYGKDPTLVPPIWDISADLIDQ